MKNSIAIIIFMHIMLITSAQTFTGKVFDGITKEPIAGASIKGSVISKQIVSSNDGTFKINETIKELVISISALGYQSKEILVRPDQHNLIALLPVNNSMQEVVVTANREASLRSQAPMAISKITPAVLDEAKATAVYEVVNKVPGVLMVNYNNEQHAMAIRQPMGTSNYYLYMEDGIPVRPMGVFNHNALLEINQFTISSIEVVKGPVSSIYGPEAVGGAINFISQRPTSVATAKIGVQFDQFGYRRLQLSAGKKFGKFGIYAGGLISDQTNSWMASSDYNKSSWNTRMEYHFSPKTRLIGTFMYANYFSNTSGTVDSIAFYNRLYVSTTDFTYRKSMASRSRITLEHEWNDHSKSFITVFNRINKHGQNPAYGIKWTSGQTTAKGEINSNDFKSYGVIAQHSQHFSFLKSNLLVGGMFDFSPNQYWSYQVDLNAMIRPDGKSVDKYTIKQERPDIQLADYDANIRNGAAYVQYDATALKYLRLSFGLRYDVMSFSYDNYLDKTSGNKKYEQLTPKAGLTYDLGNGKGVYANFSQGFAPPALTSVFRKKPNSTPAEFYYNLTSGQFNNYEIGGWASLWKNKIYADIAFYQMDGKNELLNIRQPDNSFDYQSAGKTLHRGVEYGITIKPAKEYCFRFSGTTALHRFENFLVSTKVSDPVKKLDGYIMPTSPKTTFNTELSYYPAWLPNFRSAIEWQHLDGWYENQINTIWHKGYDVFNFRIGYKWKGIELYTNVLNIADALYATSATRGNNATDRTSFTPAAPRTFVMGIQYNFVAKK
ncbi:TonB-dependent receptor [Ferruginibacter lapsinanis]|uniref:TonB-dependent receptor n=1 Tax=Ferruginibacter lapsinanis TaxID=563172 RepID=UPI001E5B9682|nr:TonB-dependent receptor [Ferruginibacter lapsinanis]UEG51033.1 TonB-dependent receptor [Ferruginibacter lapsinanis]